MTYFYISIGIYIAYITCNTFYEMGREKGKQEGFRAGRIYDRSLRDRRFSNPSTTDDYRNPDINDLLISKN